jgi:hypothetical protein
MCWTRFSPGPLKAYETLAVAIAAVTSAPRQVGDVILRDDFADNATGLLPQTGDGSNYERGNVANEYRIAKTDPTYGQLPIARLPGTYGDGSITVDARLVGATDNRYVTVGCRENGSNEYRLSLYVTDGTFTLARWDAGTQTVLQGFTANAAIRRANQTNSIELRCAGSTISAIINGTQVASVQDNTYQRGTTFIGAGVFTDVSATAEGRFAHLVLTQR